MSMSTVAERWLREMEGLRAKCGIQSVPPSSKPLGWDAITLNDLFSRFPKEASSMLDFVYYGSSDGRDFGGFKDLRNSFNDGKKRGLVLTSVTGGLFCLNLVVLLKPKRIYLFDGNPMQLLMFELIKGVVLQSRDKRDFLSRLSSRAYNVHSDWERRLQESVSNKLALDEGTRSDQTFPGYNRRPLERSWRHALNRFKRLKDILRNTPQTLLVEDIRVERFVDFLLTQPNHWIYLSNIWALPDRLRESSNPEFPPGAPLGESDTILSYSCPFRTRTRRFS